MRSTTSMPPHAQPARGAAALLALGLLTGLAACGSGGPLTLSATHAAGSQALSITLTLTDSTSQPFAYLTGCLPPYVVTMTDARGTVVQAWPSPNVVHCNHYTVVTLPAGKAQAFPIVSTNHLTSLTDAPIAASTYTIGVRFVLLRDQNGHEAHLTDSVQVNW